MNEAHVPNDVFEGLSYKEVLERHVPGGVDSVLVEPQGLPALRVEVARAVPASETAAPQQREFVQLPGFPNNLVDEGRTTEYVSESVAPNRHLLRAAALARGTGRPVRAFGFPGGPNADTLPHSLRDEVTHGDYLNLCRYYVANLVQNNITEVDVDGYSLGGAMTPDFCSACQEAGVQVKSVFWGAVGSAEYTDGIAGMAKRFLSIGNQADYDRYAAESIALSQEAERHKKAAHDLGKTAVGALLEEKVIPLAKKFGALLTPTQFAMGRSIIYGKWLEGDLGPGELNPADKMQRFLAQSPETRVYMYTGASDKLAPAAAMQRIADQLGAELTIFEGKNHSLRDDLPFMNAYIKSKL
jgi:pimeloyl-ACP methyl ester carboxylesterase